jgi:hypothetical protein
MEHQNGFVMRSQFLLCFPILSLLLALPAMAQTNPNNPRQIDIDPEVIRNSPVLQRWLRKVPDIAAEIQNDPSFRPRIRVIYDQYPASGGASGWGVSLNDLLIDRSGVALNAHYQYRPEGGLQSYGADANYYVLPLGGYFNVSPVVGYRRLESDRYKREGANIGVKVILVPSRGGGGDVTLQQTWVGLGTAEEVGIGSLIAGYAITHDLRLSGEIQFQNSRESKESRVGVGLEWMPW